MRLLVRLAAAAVVILGATAAVGLWLGGDDGDRRAGLPPPDETVATLLDDGTPVFVTRRDDDSVDVVDARTPRRAVRDGEANVVAPADLLDGLVAWCHDEGFVDDLAPPATFTLDGRATGATREGLGVYDITAQERGHVLVGTAEPAGRADGAAPDCDLADAEHHGRVMREVDLDAVPDDSSWVVEAAVDLAGGVICVPPDDPLVWPLCPDGSIDAAIGDRAPGGDRVDELVADHGRDYAERGAYGFVGRFLVAREEEGGPLTQVWRLPGEVRLRARPETVEVEATVAVGDDEPASTLRLADVEGGDVPHTVLVTATTTVVAADGEQADGEQGAELLRGALADDGDRRWRLTLRREPLAGSVRLERVEARER